MTDSAPMQTFVGAKTVAKKVRGFKSVAASISRKEHIPVDNADRILAVSSRHASAKAKKANPALKRVKG